MNSKFEQVAFKYKIVKKMDTRVRFVLGSYYSGTMTDNYQWTFVFIKSVAVYRAVSVVGEAGGADPTI